MTIEVFLQVQRRDAWSQSRMGNLLRVRWEGSSCAIATYKWVMVGHWKLTLLERSVKPARAPFQVFRFVPSESLCRVNEALVSGESSFA